MSNLFKKNNSFTILELLVVISVLAVLIGIAIPRFKGMQQQGNIAKVKAELDTFKVAIESYYMFSSPSAYPSNSYANSIGALLSGQNPKIINAPPPYDPFGASTTTEYKYIRSVNGKYYVVYSVGLNGSVGSIAISSSGTVTGRDSDDICKTNGIGCDGAPLPVANGASCTQNSGCISGFCASNHQCSDQSGGSACGVNADCQTSVCGGSNPPVCRYIGAGVNGVDPCSTGADCQSGYCDASAQCGTGANGQGCITGASCQSGYCVNGTCAATLGADGANCYDRGNSCVHGYCDQLSTICTDGSDGSSCIFGPDCASGFCVNFVCSPTAGNISDACVDSQSCASGYCSSWSGFSCTDGSIGQGCAFNRDCQAGSYCVSGNCNSSQGSPGDNCIESASCQPGTHCASGQCNSSLQADGINCSDAAPCTGGHCVNGVCRTQAGLSGEECGDNVSCASGVCLNLTEGVPFLTSGYGGGYCQ